MARAVTLLFSKNAGEEALTSGHGLQTVNWRVTLAAEYPHQSLEKITRLQVQPCRGLFTEFLASTKNTTCVYINSSAVQWRASYTELSSDLIVSLDDILSRIPDLQSQYDASFSSPSNLIPIRKLNYSSKTGFDIGLGVSSASSVVSEAYTGIGYEYFEKSEVSANTSLKALKDNLPLINHNFRRDFEILSPFLVLPFQKNNTISEIGQVYLVSYFLGNLARYFPTHWISLIQGEKGDIAWPTLALAQSFVEEIFPYLVRELILEAQKTSWYDLEKIEEIKAGPQW